MNRRYRLTDSDRFREVREAGSSFSHPLLILCVLSNEMDASRAGFTASRRVGKAVDRNRARRRMREAVRLMWDLVEPGWDMVWIARPTLNQAPFVEVQAACARLLARAGIRKAQG